MLYSALVDRKNMTQFVLMRKEVYDMSKLILAAKGTSMLPITVPADACEVVVNAAKELAHYLKRITGASFEIKKGSMVPAITLSVDKTLEEEAFVLKNDDKVFSIAAGSARGVFYGVYGFLEDVLGAAFYTADVTKLPSIETLELEDLHFTDKPVLEYRQIDYPPCMHSEWRVKNRINGTSGNIGDMDQFGGMKNYALFVHTFNRLVDPEIYFDEHPEYFSLVDGVRLKERTQLCLTNPDVIAIATESVRRELRKHPECTLISVSQNDFYNPCGCPACAKIDAENESHAGSLLYFVNAIAEAIEEEFPHVVVDTLAYMHTRTPPKKIKPRHNVCVRLCSIECCFGHPMETCYQVSWPFTRAAKTSASSFQQDLIGWGKICNRIYIWDYVTNYRHFWMPFPNLHVIGPNMRFFVNNGVKGVYEEGNPISASPDMTELRTWLLAKLLWNPDFDVKKGIFDFTESVYGPAAGEIRAYIDLLEKRVTEGNIHFGIYDNIDIEYLDDATVSEAQKLMAAAQAKELTLSQRLYVEKVALSLEFVAVGKECLKGNIDEKRIDTLMAKGRTLGIQHISESLDWNRYHRMLLDGIVYNNFEGNPDFA